MAARKITGMPSLIATPKKKPAKSSPRKSAPAPAKKTSELRKPQVRVLQALSKSKEPMTRKEISEKGDVDLAMLNSYIGAHDLKIRAKNDKAVCPSLLSLGFVKASDGEGATVYTITAAGRKAIEAAK